MTLPTYEPGAASEYCDSKGWQYRTSGNHVVLQVCPICGGDGWKFYLNNETGLWDCKRGACQKKGNFFMLKREMGDLEVRALRTAPRVGTAPSVKKQRQSVEKLRKYQDQLEADEDAIAYLASRGITMETARAWRVGLKVTSSGDRQLLIPLINQDNEVCGAKYRTLPPAEKLYLNMKDGELILFGEHMLDAHRQQRPRRLFVAEGEIDAMTLWQNGFRPVVSTTAGAGTFKADWYDTVKDFDPETIYIVYDTDPAGQKGAEDLKKRFSDRNVINVFLPEVKDANEFFQTHTADEFNELLVSTPPEGIEGVESLLTVGDELETHLFINGNSFDGLPTQWEPLNAMMQGGLWRGELIVVSGSAGTGKTSLVLQWLNRFAEVEKVPGYLMCFECPTKRMYMKLVEHREGIPQTKQTLADIQRARKTLDKLELYLGYKTGSIEEIADRVYAAVKRYGVQVIAFDNINYFVRSIGQTADEIAKVTKTLKDVAVAANLIMLGIAQPLKFDTSERVIRQSDLKGSSAIEQDGDTVILLYRKPKTVDAKKENFQAELGSHSPITLVQVTKSRWGTGGRMYLHFDGAYSRYRELQPDEMGGTASYDQEAA
jgi:twinkle protein